MKKGNNHKKAWTEDVFFTNYFRKIKLYHNSSKSMVLSTGLKFHLNYIKIMGTNSRVVNNVDKGFYNIFILRWHNHLNPIIVKRSWSKSE